MATNQARTDTVRRSRQTPMSDHQLVGFLGRKIYQAMNDEDGDLSDTRQDSFDRYLGDLYGNERDGYSKFTTREVLETVEWILPSVLRVFLGSDKVVNFDPVNPEDEDAADQETDIVNHKVLKANGGDGFLALHHFFKDALLYPNAYIKAYVDEEDKTTTHRRQGLDAVALAMIVDDEANTITEQNSYVQDVDIQMPDGTTQSVAAELFDITYRRTETVRQLKIEPIPGEEALIDNDCTSINIDTADFSCHRVRKSFTELVQEGFDREQLEDVGTYEDFQWNDERTNRLFYEDEDPDAEDEDDPSMRRFWVHDCRVWVDYDGDGIGEFRHIVLIGTHVFVNEETDYQPMVALSSILMPHKHNGMSFSEIVKDLQELKTTLLRQLLDNVYRVNIRRKYIGEDSLLEDGSTMEAMLNIAAEFIPVRGLAANAVEPEITQPIVNEILPVMQYIDESKGNRTGVNPQVNLDPNVLQQSTAGAFMGALEQASQRVEMLVRIFAETGVKQLMRKVHYLIRTYPDIATTVKLRGQWVSVDPEGWRDRTEMTVNVGLGFNNKQQMIGMLVQLLQIQREAAAENLAGPREVYNTLSQLVEASSMGDTSQFFIDPKTPNWQPPQPPPDPQMELAQAQSQALLQEQQRKMAEVQQRGSLDANKLQLETQMGNRQNQLDTAVKMGELQIKERELNLKERELVLKEREISAAENLRIAETDLKDEQALKTRIEGIKLDKEIDQIGKEKEDSNGGMDDNRQTE